MKVLDAARRAQKVCLRNLLQLDRCNWAEVEPKLQGGWRDIILYSVMGSDIITRENVRANG